MYRRLSACIMAWYTQRLYNDTWTMFASVGWKFYTTDRHKVHPIFFFLHILGHRAPFHTTDFEEVYRPTFLRPWRFLPCWLQARGKDCVLFGGGGCFIVLIAEMGGTGIFCPLRWKVGAGTHTHARTVTTYIHIQTTAGTHTAWWIT